MSAAAQTSAAASAIAGALAQRYLAPVEQLIAHAARQVQLLGALTPIDAHRERARLADALRSGAAAVPRWTYPRRRHDDLLRALDAAERALTPMTDAAIAPIAGLYADRLRELSLEASMCAAAGTSEFSRLARRRFAPPSARIARAASKLCAAWLAEPAHPASGQGMASDDPDARSLLSRMRAAVGRLRLPFTVLTEPSLAPLAATGERTILVAAGRFVHDEDAERTVLHEIEGHARPRAQSMRARSALFRAGTAGGADDQEGRALLLEDRAGMLGPRRRRQLAARHRAVQAMLDGASFAEVASTLIDQHALDVNEAVVVTERAFRGGDGVRPGLGRERVYLESLIRVRAHLAARPEDERVLESGQVAANAVDVLRAYAPDEL